MARLNRNYNVLNLPDVEYESSNSREDTVQLVHLARKHYLKNKDIVQISDLIGRSPKRTKELITGVNQLPNSNVFKIISGIEE